MVKKIGEIGDIVVCALVGICSLSAQDCVMKLSVTDRSGQNVTQVQVGVPFYMTVSVSGKSRSLPNPELTGVDTSYIKGQSTSQDISMINGDLTATTRYTYVMLLDTEGSYTFGPAVGEYQDQEILSNTVTISAGHKKTVEVNKAQNAFGTIFFSKKEAFYQEPVECYIRFYYSVDGIHLQEISAPSFKGCIAEPLSKPRSGVEQLDGVQYRYLEWKTIVYANTTGEVTVSPIGLRYLEPRKRRSMMGGSLFNDFFDMMGGFEEEKEMYTNSAQLNVLPLPSHDQPVHAVGNFSRVNMKIANKTVTVGEGIVLSLEVVGEGNLFALSHPQLHVAANCTFYEGNSSYKSEQKPSVKTFEYVLQAHTPGTYTIPAQQFMYFDLDTQTYKTLETAPIGFTVTGSVSSSKVQAQDTTASSVEEQEIISKVAITHEGSFQAFVPLIIPWPWYFILVMCPPLSLLIFCLYWLYRRIYDARSIIRRYELAFKHARKQLEIARRKKLYGYVYSIVMNMLAERFKVDVQTLTENNIEQKLAPHLSQAQLVQWRLFYVMMNEAAFACTTEESDVIFTQAFQWLYTCEKIL